VIRVVPAILLAALLAAPAARAEETDYLPHSTSWNGLSSLDTVARGVGHGIIMLPVLDWGNLPAKASLMIVHPRGALDVKQTRKFLQRGGRLLVADDFGEAAPLLASLGIRRVQGVAVRAKRHHNRNPNLPLARPGTADHPLTAGVAEVLTNHPAYFLSLLPTLLGFDGAQQLLVAGRVGAGRLVALSDPSVLINCMQRFRHNRRLSKNLIKHLAPEGGGPIYLVSGHFRSRGAVPTGPASRAGTTQGFLTEFNTFLGGMNDFALKEQGLRVLGIVSGCLVLLGLMIFLPLPRRDLDGRWIRPHGSPLMNWGPASIGRASRWRPRHGNAFPAAVLREEVEELLGEVLQAPGPVSTIHPRWIVRRTKEAAGDEAARVCSRLLALLRRVPHPGNAMDSQPLHSVSRRELKAMYNLSQTLYTLLGRDSLPAISRRRDHANH